MGYQQYQNFGLFKVNLEMTIFGCDLENEISVCVRNWELKTWVSKSRFSIQVCVRNWELKTWILKPRFENSGSWLLSKKAIIN
jgi:hypothetical protein